MEWIPVILIAVFLLIQDRRIAMIEMAICKLLMNDPEIRKKFELFRKAQKLKESNQ